MSFIAFFLAHSRKVVILSVVAGVISGVSNAALLAAINAALPRQPAASLWLIAAFVGLCVLLPIARFASETLLNGLGQEALSSLRLDLIRRVLAAPLRHVEQVGPHRVLAALTDDVPLITGSIVSIPLLCVNMTVVIGCLVYLGLLSPTLLGIVLGFLVLGIATYQVPIVRAAQVFRLGGLDGDLLARHFRAVTHGLKELKIHQARRHAFLDDVVAPAAASLQRHNTTGLRIYSAASAWGQTLVFVVIGLMLFLLPRLRPLDTPTLMGYVLALLYLMMPLQVIMNMLPGLARSNVALKRVHALGLELSARGVDAEAPMPAPADAASWRELRFDSVRHAYRREGEALDFVLGPLSLTFEPGETVFVIGGNGSGKTTFIKLLTGLYAPEAGAIAIDGRAISDATRDSYRQMFSVLFADFFLFEELLGVASDDLDDRARHYLAQLKLTNKVQVENGRLSTIDLSQGQRKRLALLTAMLDDRPIYVFDEWAADQDPHFKHVFYMDLLPALKARGKTIIVISHDDRYYHVADRTIKLEDGQVVRDTGRTNMADDMDDATVYKVVVNHEEQYSIWPAHRENALGWRDVGPTGSKDECLAHIKEVWTDMRPLSLRQRMASQPAQ